MGMARMSKVNKILTSPCRSADTEQPGSSCSSDIEFEFLEDTGGDHQNDQVMLSSAAHNNSIDECRFDETADYQDNDSGPTHEEEAQTFWENQHRILQATLYRTSSLESKVRNAIKEALKEIQNQETLCACGRPMATGCRNCLMRELSGRLQNAGYNSALCKSKWRTHDIPSGEHSFVDVIEASSSKKGGVRVIIELNFRAEFEMARASEEYNRLVQRLPEVFVGKAERLHSLIKILCMAAKRCMKEKKIHMGPWRKPKYMQAKWSSACERTPSAPPFPMSRKSKREGYSKPRASMLTLDLSELKLHNINCPAVEVV